MSRRSVVSKATIRHRELQQQAKELRQLAVEYQASAPSSPERKEAKQALRDFALGGLRMSEVYDVAIATYGTHAVRGVSDAWTLTHGWSA
jgi:hypothetical protein